MRSGLRFHAEDAMQGSLWEDRVILDEAFYAALRDHPVPLLEAAIRQLRDRSMSLDILSGSHGGCIRYPSRRRSVGSQSMPNSARDFVLSAI